MEIKTWAEMPDDWTFLEAVVSAKCLDEKGDVQIWHSATEGLNTWEAIDLLVATSDRLRQGLWNDEDDE